MKTAVMSIFTSGLIVALPLFSDCTSAAEVSVLAQEAIPSAETLFSPIALTAPAGDSQHLYVAYRKHARIYVHDRDTGERLNAFINLPDTTAGQEGLLSFAFHPNYANNGLFYTYIYRNSEHMGRIVEHKRSEENPLVADPNYERQIFALPNEDSHNGGWIGFGPQDGYLYFTTGDGGANQGADNGLPAQDSDDVHGKILRFDLSGDDYPLDDDRNYAIPGTNPFATTGGAPEVFALGLRHPYRASFDQQTGDLYIGDVGAGAREEINFLPAGTNGGQNYGWRVLEGTLDNPGNNDPLPPNPLPPIHEYPNPGGAAVIGGSVYRGTEFPALQGTYFFAEFVQRQLFSFDYDGSQLNNLAERTSEMFPSGIPQGSVTSFGDDGLGELYIVTDGAIFRIEGNLKGDYNRNGTVDAADYTVWLNTLGSSTDLAADGDGSGIIDSGDFDVWKAHFGTTLASSLNSPIPEPAAGLLALMLALGVLISRYRCH